MPNKPALPSAETDPLRDPLEEEAALEDGEVLPPPGFAPTHQPPMNHKPSSV